MKLIKLATKLGYKHHTQHTIEELDDLSSTDVNKQIELFLLQRWLREVHKINVESNYLPNIQKYGCLYIPMTGKASINDLKHVNRERYNSYEEALEIGLFKALELIK
jgi:hypothetical protein